MTKQVAQILSVAAVMLASGCANTPEVDGPSRSGSADYQVYESVASLVHETDETLEVKIVGVASKEYDNGGDDTDEEGFPMAFWTAEVYDVVEGDSDIAVGDSIVVGWPDLELIQLEGRSALKPGQDVVIFAVRRTSIDAPGIDTQEVFYVPLGGDNGVMDVSQDHATARSGLLSGLASGADSGQAQERLSVSLTDLKQAVAEQHRKDG